MKIIISPAKTQSDIKVIDRDYTNPLFLNESIELFNKVKELSKEELAKALSIKDKVLNETYEYFHNKDIENHAISLYTGQVFKGLELDTYNSKQLEYLEEHLYILSALYGVLKPFDKVRNYRLDMKSKIGINLSKYWQEKVNSVLDNELIINLASSEFSSLYQGDNMYTITFMENNSGKLKVCATYSKIARGRFLNYLIKECITSIEDIRDIKLDGYEYNIELSSKKELVFVREN